MSETLTLSFFVFLHSVSTLHFCGDPEMMCVMCVSFDDDQSKEVSLCLVVLLITTPFKARRMRNTTLLCGVLLCLLVHLGTPKGSFVMKKPLKIDVKYQKKSQKINKQNIGSHRNKQSTATIKSPTGPMSDVSRGLMNNFLSLTSHIKGRIETYLTLIFQKR